MRDVSVFSPEILNCEDEKIHLCGKIQDFGYLLVLNEEFSCVAISKNFEDFLKDTTDSLLNKSLNYFESLFNFKIKSDLNELKAKSLINKIDIYIANYFQVKYQISVYYEDNHIFLEFEKLTLFEVDFIELQEVQNEIDKSKDVWKTLSDNFTRIIDFDRIMIYKFLDDNSGCVIAENVRENMDSVLGFRYPEFDIPAQARALYAKNLSRQTPNIFKEPVPIVGYNPQELNLSKSQVRAPSPIHLEYLKNTGVVASASFSIIINNKLWGLVCCQNKSEKYISLDNKRLCLFLINYTINNYISDKQTKALERAEDIKKIELELKESLFYSKDLSNTLDKFSDKFMDILQADGLVIQTPKVIKRYGNAPSEKDFLIIKNDIDQQNPNRDVVSTHEYSKIKSDVNLDTKNYTGIARINLDKESAYSIYWFRKEIIKKETWAGEPQKYLKQLKEGDKLYYSPRLSFLSWQTQVLYESEKWTEFDKNFLEVIYRLIKSSIIRKMEDFNELNDMLSLINKKIEQQTNSKDNFSKIDAITKSPSYLKSIEGLSDEELYMYSDHILEATILVNDIITKTIDYNLDNPKNRKFKNIDTENFLNHIIEQAVDLYKVENFKVHLGELYPIKADKTLLYQLFMNLIFNAIKFSSKQSLANLEVYSVLKDDYVVYYIKDNGMGMETGEKDGIFDIFKKLSNATVFEGQGVGLAVVKRIIQRLNAQISFESQLGIGTTFIISFPND